VRQVSCELSYIRILYFTLLYGRPVGLLSSLLYSECVNGSLLCTGRSCRENCTEDEYRCPGEDRCVPVHYRCDGIVDCASKLDEIGCGQSVSQSLFGVHPHTHAHTHTHTRLTALCPGLPR